MDSKYVDDLIDEDEVPELTKEDFAAMRPFSELPADLRHVLTEIQKGNVTIRPDEEKVAVRISAVGGGALSGEWERVGETSG